MLEDDYADVFGKAMIGCGVSKDNVVNQSGVSADDLKQFTEGEFSADIARAVAPVLGLKLDAFVGLPKFVPVTPDLPEVKRLKLPFGRYDVNAWWLEVSGTKLLFDAGYDAGELMAALPKMPDHAFITHDHHDHVAGVNDLKKQGVTLHEVDDLKDGDEIDCGPLTIRVCDLSGHASPQWGFHIDGLALPVLVVGDALFAGSMGKCAKPVLYQHALVRLHDVIDRLPGETVLLPGHGPMTTIGEERMGNPFL